jgi:hypothetical protein
MATETNHPLIQIDDLIREMTEEEYAAYVEMQAEAQPLLHTAGDPA